ncbi:hypothetical protein N1I81_13305 [Bacillus sp. FSL M8-0052]
MIYKYPTIIKAFGQQEKSLTIHYFFSKMFVFYQFDYNISPIYKW